MESKRKSLKQLLLTSILISVILIIAVITAVNVHRQSDEITDLSESLLSLESISYANEIYNWWSLIESRVQQTADVWKNSPVMTHDEERELLLALTAADPDSQDIYVAYGDEMVFLDGSGWMPDETFVFTDRAWYQGAIAKKGALYTSAPYVDASTGKTCLACAVLLADNVVLSSDINFDQMKDRMESFQSSSKDVEIYIVDEESGDILLSTNDSVVGDTISGSNDPIIKGLSSVYSGLDTSHTFATDKVVTTKTGAGKMMYTATAVEGTSWVVVSATPFSFITGRTMSSLGINLVISFILLLSLTVYLYFSISRFLNPVSTVSSKIVDLTGGDFTTRIQPEGNNEITTLSEQLNGYIERMRRVLLHLTQISGDMSGSAEHCFSISSGLSQSNSLQGDSIERLNEYLNELNHSIEEVANAATELANVSAELASDSNEARTLCNETVKSSEEGRAEMRVMTDSVTVLNHTISDLTEIIHRTADTVGEIKGITETIGSIAAQTNLLSLNASIEAARAGEMGKGFAVVAGEVGALANQSSGAAAHITSLVETITENIVDINKKADGCLKDMEKCIQGVGRTNESFDSIYADITKATEAIGGIVEGVSRINEVASNNAAVTEEQAATVNQIIELSGSIVTESGKISGETDRLSAVSEKLNGYSSSIMDDLGHFRVN